MAANSSVKSLTLSGITIKSTDGFQNDNGNKDPEGTFTAYANVYNVIDAALDVTVKGCFDDCIAACKANGRFPKLMAQHEHGKAPIGIIVDMWTDDYGLMVKCQLCLDTQMGREYHALIKMKALDTMSIGYFTDEAEKRQYNGYELQYLLKLDVFEVSVVSFACNDYSRIQDVKSQVKPVNDKQKFIGGDEMRFGECKTLAELPKNYAARVCGVKDLFGMSFDEVRGGLYRELIKIVGHDSYYLYEVYDGYCVVEVWDFVEQEYKGLRAEYTINENKEIAITSYEWGNFQYNYTPVFVAYAVEPETKAIDPEVEPETKATDPVVEPESKSIDPVVEPETKAADPEVEPETKATDPAVEPETKGDPTIDPVVEPETKAADPVVETDPEVEPETKGFDFSQVDVKSWF